MTPEDVYKHRIVIGDKVRFEGEEYVVYDFVDCSLRGDKMLVEITPGQFVNITEVEKI